MIFTRAKKSKKEENEMFEKLAQEFYSKAYLSRLEINKRLFIDMVGTESSLANMTVLRGGKIIPFSYVFESFDNADGSLISKFWINGFNWNRDKEKVIEWVRETVNN